MSRRSAVLGIGFVICAVVAVFIFAFHGGGSGAMSSAQARRLRVGESRTAVEKAVGSPMSSIDPARIPAPPAGRDCVYYTRSDSDSADTASLYRLCYLAGSLDSMVTITDSQSDGTPVSVSGV